MARTCVGLDVSVKETAVCIVDDTGKLMCEQSVPTDPEDIVTPLISVGKDYGRELALAAGVDPDSRSTKAGSERGMHVASPKPPAGPESASGPPASVGSARPGARSSLQTVRNQRQLAEPVPAQDR
jgi:hypothetical protein